MIEILVNNLILAITLIVPVLAYECCVVSCTCPQAIWGTIIIYVVFNFLLFCFIFDTESEAIKWLITLENRIAGFLREPK
jgi:hypothetical protein